MKWVSIDCETTGLHSDYDSVIEVGAVEYDENGFTGREYHWMYYPESGIIPRDAIAVHGITVDDVKNCPMYSGGGLECLLEFVGDAQITGYNIKRFDSKFLGLSPDDCEDVMINVQRVYGGKYLRLSEAYKKVLGKEPTAGHRAVADAKMSAEIHLGLMGKRFKKIADKSIINTTAQEPNKITCNLPKLPTLHY